MMGAMSWIHLLVTIACVAWSCYASECPMNEKECVFYFEVDARLTMMDKKTLVFPANGNIYKYDVTNTSSAQPVSTDNVITTDGWEEPRLVTVVNGQFPGPDIVVYEGQTIIVHVKNMLTSNAVTIHWHGLHQRDTPWMDGVPYVTQCPIHPHQTFVYKFKAKPRGTFWWHSHMGAQRSMGVSGAFIIKDRHETTVEDRIMQIADWNHDWDSDTGHMKMLYGVYEGREKWGGTQSLDGSFFSFFKVQSGLINGKGRYYNPETGKHNQAPLTVFSVTQGKKYRFRVIGVGSLYPFRISVDNHVMTVIASDGYDLEPVEAESFVINPGERFDFEITANNDVGNYWIRGETLQKDTPHFADAILRYVGAPAEEPTTTRHNCTSDSPCLVLNCPFTYYPAPNTVCRTFDELRAKVTDDPAPSYMPGKFKEYFLNFAFPGITSYPGSVNGKTFDTPDVNPLLQPKEWYSPCKSPECGDDRHCKCTHALQIGNGDTVQMTFMNMGIGKGWSHPIHMHGHSFYVVKMGYGQYNATSAKIEADNIDVDCRGGTDREKSFCNDATWSNAAWLNGNVPGLELDRPPRKDTIIVPTGGYVVIRIRADNPGLWNMHCHIELHNLDGMQMLLNESFNDLPTPPRGFPECHSFPPSDYRLVNKDEPTNNKTMMEPESAENQYMTESRYNVLLGLLIAVVSLQVLFGLGICCAINSKKSSSSSKYNMGQPNSGFDGKL
ncbi:uncharacterized protein LOC132725369 [Ruditapes philippinarum]|uniref:uncharacterized protein LOC132725369 n=1 Tax=Ruditapes philippinarum TaxID=129788 RepID=UPI00295A8493|nr:uncharacterized protein LOC132725369 [Ruditapes philippinarum]